MKRSFLAMGMAAVVMASLITGCGVQKPDTGSNSAENSEEKTEAQSKEEEGTGEAEKGA